MMQQDEKTPLKTLSSLMNKLKEEGFTENFIVSEHGRLHGVDSSKVYIPSEVRIANFYRFEGESDPADNAILYAIETSDGLKGTLSDSYGVYADENVTRFISEVEDIMKKTNPDEKL